MIHKLLTPTACTHVFLCGVQQAPFLLLTADATRATVLKARQSGANQFMVKPFKVENLLDNVRKLLAS